MRASTRCPLHNPHSKTNKRSRFSIGAANRAKARSRPRALLMHATHTCERLGCQFVAGDDPCRGGHPRATGTSMINQHAGRLRFFPLKPQVGPSFFMTHQPAVLERTRSWGVVRRCQVSAGCSKRRLRRTFHMRRVRSPRHAYSSCHHD